jgi:uncharacterized protein YbaP (TraB family)
MKFRLPAFLLCALLVPAAVAVQLDQPQAQPQGQTQAQAAKRPLLWKVSDADNAIYLLGSFHLLKADDYPLSKDVDAAFEDAESVAFEVAPSEMASPQLAMSMVRAGLRTDGKPLSETLPPETAAKFDAWLKANGDALGKMGLPPTALQSFEPWYVGIVVSLTEMGKLGLEPANGLDNRIGQRAEASGKPTLGLERGEDQIAVLDGMTSEEQLQFLREALGDAENASGEVGTMHAAWRRGDADALLKEMGAEMRTDYPALYQRINVARNDAWVPKLRTMLDDAHGRDTLVVVGSLHLLGEDGVVEKLRAKGYKVERICSLCDSAAARSR